MDADLLVNTGSGLARSPDCLRIYSFHNIAPDNLGCMGGMYSRSADSILTKVAQVTREKSHSFYDRFYHNYGHRSLGDMSMPNFALEGLTELEALFVTGIRRHRTRWNGQQRSTRYQDFAQTGYIVPEEVLKTPWQERFIRAADGLFAAYRDVLAAAEAHFLATVARPAALPEREFRRKIRARSFDVARYLLPLATATSLFQITSARTLEEQISDLLSSPYPRVRRIGERLRDACREDAIDPKAARIREIARSLADRDGHPQLVAELLELTEAVQPAPTLVKYTQPDGYWLATQAAFAEVAGEVLGDGGREEAAAWDPGTAPVDLVPVESPEVELVSRILYQLSHRSFRSIVASVSALPRRRLAELVDLAFARRGPHDEWLPEARTGLLNFDVVMDVGGYRDLHRHRRCEQFLQPLGRRLGYETPDLLAEIGMADGYRQAIAQAEQVYDDLAAADPASATYLLTMAHRCRSLFAMDLAEVAYIAELRTKASGHFSYRRIAYLMYEAAARRYPQLARRMRVTRPEEEDLLYR